MKTLKFDGFEAEISEEELSKDVLDISFGGYMMVQFTKQKDGTFRPTNAVDGWGKNCYKEVKDKELLIINQ